MGRDGAPAVKLQPRRPPGRIDRKAAVYASEIARLRSAGYTYEAIREALADVGVGLSTSALRREVRRLRNQPVVAPPIPHPEPECWAEAGSRISTSAPASLLPSRLRPAAPTDSSGHAIAEAFFDAHPSNPLLSTSEVS
jgi:hypothetical protein